MTSGNWIPTFNIIESVSKILKEILKILSGFPFVGKFAEQCLTDNR